MTTATYLKFRRLLAARQRDADINRDIRKTILDRCKATATIGYVSRTLEKANGANMRQLFPKAVAIDAENWRNSHTFLLTGTLFAEPEHSHPALTRALDEDIPLEDSFLFELGFLASTHSWSHSFRQGDPSMACLGYVYDDMAHYFMADYPNRLIQWLNGDHRLTSKQQARARGLIDRIARQRISKYNAQPLVAPTMTRGYKRRVLVCDQTYADASTVYGRIDETGFEAMLLAAIKENPDAEILIKSHPDTAWEPEKRTGYYNHLSDTGRVRILRAPINPYMLFDQVDKVYVGTSQIGLEALFAGKEVICFGAPFYAGWGLTDDRQEIPHRHRSRTLEDVFHAFYIWYTIYHVPGGAQMPSEIEEVLDYIIAHRPVSVPAPRRAAAKNPKVSVIIPVYNVEAYVEECIQSIQSQTLEEIEIIVINDRSPDQSQAIIDQLAAEDLRIKSIVMERNIGQGFARNIGLEQARGDYVLFIDSDDYLASSDHLRRAYECALEDKADMVRGRKVYERFEDQNGDFIANQPDVAEIFFNQPLHAVTLEQEPQILQNRHFWTWLYRRDFLETHKIRFLTSQWEERPFLLRALLSAERLSSIDSDGFVYRVRPESTARRAKSETDAFNQLVNLEQMIDILDDFSAFVPGSPLRYTAGFMTLQALHILFKGFAYRTVSTGGQTARCTEFLDRLTVVLGRTGLEYADLPHDPHQLSQEWLGTHAYRLLFEALRSRRYNYVNIAYNLSAIPQETLFAEMLRRPDNDIEEAFQVALSLYARNDKVTTAPNLAPVATKPRLVLHVGQTKTGSTYIQHFLERNRAALLRAGIWCPEVGLFWQKNRPHKQAGHAHFTAEAVQKGEQIKTYIEAGLRLAGGRIHTVILSSEAYFLNRRSVLITDHFDDYKVEMIGYFRRQDDWANSQYAEFVAGGAMGRVSARFSDWIKEPVTRERLDYFSYCQLWAARIGRQNVHARLYDRGAWKNGDILSDFLAVLGFEDMDALPRPTRRQSNEFPFGRAHVELLREINRYDWPDTETYLAFIEEITNIVAVDQKRRGEAKAQVVIIQPHERGRLMGELSKSNARFVQAFLPEGAGAFDVRHKTETQPLGNGLSEAEVAAIFSTLERYQVDGMSKVTQVGGRPEKPVPSDRETMMHLPGIYCDFVSVPERATAGDTLNLELSLFNVSPFRLPPMFGGLPLTLSYHVLDMKGQPVIWDGQRTPLKGPVDHDHLERIQVALPTAAGTYLLQAALVCEGHRWFESRQTWPLTLTR